MLYSSILKDASGLSCFPPYFILLSLLRVMSSAALCIRRLWERGSWEWLSSTQLWARGLICCTGSHQGHSCDISLPHTPQTVWSLVFKILTIKFGHSASFNLKVCWVTHCSFHLPISPPSLSPSLLFAILPSSFPSLFVYWSFTGWIRRRMSWVCAWSEITQGTGPSKHILDTEK